MAKYHLTQKAVEDLAAIWNYTYETWSETQADKYYSILLDLCAMIAKRPDAGREYKEVHPGLWGCKAHKHIIFYRVVSKGVIEITRILHSSMDLKRRSRE